MSHSLTQSTRLRPEKIRCWLLGLVVLAALPVAGQSAAATAVDRGPSDPGKIIALTLHLRLNDAAAFDATVERLYDPASPAYHHWMDDAALARFAPSQAAISGLRAALAQAHLQVLGADRNGFSLRVQGRAGDVARAFNTEIHEFDRAGRSFRAATGVPHLSGAMARSIAAIAGIDSYPVRPMLARAEDFATGQPPQSLSVAGVEASGGLDSVITDVILAKKTSYRYRTPGASLPVATYAGLVYDSDGKTRFPDFTPAQLQAIYGLNSAYKSGLDGSGQTIVLLEAYGYESIERDANAFNKMTELPKLDSGNFRIIYPEGKPADPHLAALTGWDIEIALDVQWAHAMAPDAKILVVASNGQDSEDFQQSMQYIIDHKLGDAVSDSWGEDLDLYAGPDEQESFERILKIAAAKGISFQFSSGDSGDSGLGTPLGAPGVPAVAPHATAVGGTAIVNTVYGSGAYRSIGWGDTFNHVVARAGPYDPPDKVAFGFGGGGGESVYFPKPKWQSALPGKGRQTPDISALADPYTGVPIVLYGAVERGWGGTSLASPVFTAIWAIAEQKAGKSLGQAAPLLARLKTGITDVVPLTTGDDAAGSITDAKGRKTYSAEALFAGAIPGGQPFLSAVWNQTEYQTVLLGLALDTSLTVTKGWDNATGYGTPEGLAFIDAAAAAGG